MLGPAGGMAPIAIYQQATRRLHYQVMKEKQEKFLKGEDLSSSAESPAIAPVSNAASSSEVPQTIQALQCELAELKHMIKDMQKHIDEVAELKEKVNGMQEQIDRLSAYGWHSWQGQWAPTTAGPSGAAEPWR